MFNWCTATDSYKVSHWKQYPPGTTSVYSYFEARKGPEESDGIVFFGLQYLLQEYLQRRVTQADVTAATAFWRAHFGGNLFNVEGWQSIVDDYDGRLPLRVCAVPEGTVMRHNNVMFTVENTDPRHYWLTNWVETMLTHVWYPTTVASRSRAMKRVIRCALELSGDPAGLPYKLHDFGFRGVSSYEQAALGGAAHLLNFHGTDTAPGIELLMRYYDAEPGCGVSIPASEHSTITAWGRDAEGDAFENMLDQYPTGLVACVSDSYDIRNACRRLWGDRLRDKILSRDGTLVVRPDSGELPGALIETVADLADAFGTERNEKGYRVLPPQVRVIQGDGIDPDMVTRISGALMTAGFSVDNIAFGSGGGLLQKLDRDTFSHAFKCSSVIVSGEERDVYKDPVGGGKRSKRGRLKLTLGPSGHETRRQEQPGQDLLRAVFENGEVLERCSLADIRERCAL